MTRPRAVVPIVLAAGASRRMGRPKALLDFDGRSALELILRACEDAGLARARVVVAPDAGEVGARAADLGAVVVVNPRPDRGQTSSLQEGLRAIPEDARAFLLWPVDYPLVEASLVVSLVERWSESARAGAASPIVAPSYRGRRGHPVLVGAELVPEFLALAQPGAGAETGAIRGTARDVIRRNAERIFYVATADGAVASDLDTPEDYRRMLTYHRARRRGLAGG